MQQQIDTRSTMRHQVRSLTKFQMLRLIHPGKTPAKSPNHLETSDFDPQTNWEEKQILGLPGFRTSGTHTGLDPIESASEMAFEIGKFIRMLFTDQLHTHNLFYLIGMSIAGLCLIIPLMFLVVQSRLGGWNDQSIWLGLLFTPLAFGGIALWINVSDNVQSHYKQPKSH